MTAQRCGLRRSNRLLDPEAALTPIGSGWVPEAGMGRGRAHPLLQRHPGDTRWAWSEERGMESRSRRAQGQRPRRRPRRRAHRLRSGHEHGRSVPDVTEVPMSSRSITPARTSTAPTTSSRAADGAVYFTDPDFGRWNDWIGGSGAARWATAASTPLQVGRQRGRAARRPGRVRPAQRPVLLARPDPAVRQRRPGRTSRVFDVAADGAVRWTDPLRGVGCRRETRTTVAPRPSATPTCTTPARSNIEVRRAGQRVDDRAGRSLGVQPRGGASRPFETPEVTGNLTWGGPSLHPCS